MVATTFCPTQQSVGIFEDAAGWIEKDYVPAPYRDHPRIKGVYLYVVKDYNLKGENWENVIRTFCQDQVGINLSGRGSVKIACDLIQANWGKFTIWMKNKYSTYAR